MSTERPTQSDRELWQSLATDQVAAGPMSGGPTSGSVADLDFAAWLEGRLPESAAARIEAAVAADPEMRRAALELSEVLGMPLPAAPARLEVRAKALVGFEVEQRAKRTGVFDWLFARDRRFVLPRVATLAAALIIAISGFMLGGGLGESMAQERYAMASQSDTSNELADFLVSDGI
jgi:anti-sigma factor RsiW